MSTEELQKRTTVNVQEKANLIWAIADKLVGTYKPHEYGNVILPMCVVKRFSDTLAPTKDAVLKANKLCDERGLAVRKGFLTTASGYDFYNTSPFTFEGLLSDAENIADNFRSYLNHFSENVVDIIEKFDFDKEITKLDHNGILYNVIQEFCTKKAYMGADAISAIDMGYIFEELVRKFSESYDEQAGAHFTARDIIYLMVELLIVPVIEVMKRDGIVASVYDMTMGTSQMIDCMFEKLMEIDPEAQLTGFGQELNEQTFAIAKANMLIKGGDAENMRHGNTLSDDKFSGYLFDFIISNPPFGIEWKNEKAKVEEEFKKGDMGRFAPGLPAIGDSQQLFMLNGIAKLKDTGRMAIIQNGSPLFKGDAGSGESNIRGYLLDNDWLEAIVQIPNDMFYNTGIATYIWIVTKNKTPEKAGKVQLIDASKCCEKRRKPLGNKRNEFTDRCIKLVTKAYMAFADGVYHDGELVVESKVKENEDFKYTKVVVERPMKDEDGNPILKKGKPLPDTSLRDTENIPFKEDIEEYMQKNVYPYASDAWIDEKKSKIGYEIPFTREFYKYVAPRKSEEIFAHLQELEQQESSLMVKNHGQMSRDMKYSGVDWIGEIPKWWKVQKMKNICNRITDGSHFSPERQTEGLPYITVSNVYDGIVHVDEAYRIKEEDFDLLVSNGCKPDIGDVLLSKDGTVGRTAVVKNGDYVVLSSLGILTPGSDFSSQYLKYLLDADCLQKQMQLAMAGSALRRITIGKINELLGIVPPPSEQQAIASCLDEKCAEIDALIEVKQAMIEELKEYKKSIIYEYVTGKKEVV